MKLSVILALITCVVMFGYMLIIPYFGKASILLKFLPDDIYQAGKDHPAPSKARQTVGWILTILFLLAYVSAMVYIGYDGLKNQDGFKELSIKYIVFLYIIKAFDIMILDQWLCITVNYFKKFYPETGHCAGWHDRNFNTKNQAVRLILYPFLCMLTAWIVMQFKG